VYGCYEYRISYEYMPIQSVPNNSEPTYQHAMAMVCVVPNSFPGILHAPAAAYYTIVVGSTLSGTLYKQLLNSESHIDFF
jgi:hypothetical protein